MIDPAYIDQSADIARAAQQGAPLALEAVGRLVGLGAEERTALGRGKIPGWLWLGAALAIGVVAGARLQKAYPARMPRIISGGR